MKNSEKNFGPFILFFILTFTLFSLLYFLFLRKRPFFAFFFHTLFLGPIPQIFLFLFFFFVLRFDIFRVFSGEFFDFFQMEFWEPNHSLEDVFADLGDFFVEFDMWGVAAEFEEVQNYALWVLFGDLGLDVKRYVEL